MKKNFIKFLLCGILIAVLAGAGINTNVKAESDVYFDDKEVLNDFRDETIYFVITTRFYDGDESNNVQCWDGQALNEDDPPWRGDFKGLIDKLDYIKAQGFSAIWITPVVENASGYDYHGYHALNFSEIDSRYESDDCTYQDLIDAVHARGMKIIQDVVFNHTGNFGEENLLKLFVKNKNADLSDIEDSMEINPDYLPYDYFTMAPSDQYYTRLNIMKNLDGKNNDVNNIYHHHGDFNWDDYTCQIAQIAGDCVDLNTENPVVYKYLVNAYSKYIEMGVDAFRVDTVRHISRLTLNKAFINQLNDVYNEVHGTSGEGNFYMFGEVCTRYSTVWYREVPALSTPFYTWKENKDYAWDDDENNPEAYITNMASTEEMYNDNTAGSISSQPTSTNAFLNGNSYHSPDYTKASGLNVIDFPMHWNFKTAKSAFNTALSSDKYYNDATFNVTYVDSHDYAPDHAPEDQRFAGDQSTWAENLDLMFTFRGIPCIYYGTEVEFQKGKKIDAGPTMPLEDTGRAYFGDNIEGSVDTVDFATYTNATGEMAKTLGYPLALHVQRLNRLRAAIPALRKGQYGTENISYSNIAFKRRYTDKTTDSFVLVTISGDATFNSIPNGKYTDAITGDVINVTNGSLSAKCSKKGDMRVYVLDTNLTKAPGMVEGTGDYLSGGCEVVVKENPVTDISINATEQSVEIGDTLKLYAEITPINATNKDITWTSSDESVATVVDGKVKPVSAGTVYIAASTENGLRDVITVTVTATGVQVESVSLSEESAELTIGETLTLNATILPEDAFNKNITWTTSNKNIARVSDGGVTAKALGTAVITATSVNGKSMSTIVTVKSKAVTGDVMYFEKPADWSKTIYCYMWNDAGYKNAGWPGVKMEAFTDDVFVIGYPENTTGLNVIFSDGSNQTADLKASVNGCYTKDGLKTAEPMEQISVSEVKTSQKDYTLDINETVQLECSVLPENATNKALVWSSSDESVAKVGDTGLVTGKSIGNAVIYATANNGIRAEINITVTGVVAEPDKTDLFMKGIKADRTMIEKGDTINVEASAISMSGKNISYKFTLITGEKEEVIQDYSESKNTTITLENPGTYTIKAYAKTDDDTVVSAFINNIKVMTKEITVTSFDISKKSGVKIGTTVSLSATAAGGTEKYQYRFAYTWKGKTVKLTSYQDDATATLKFVRSGTYKIYVYAKDTDGNTVKKSIKNYVVKPASMNIKTFKTNVKSGKAKKGKSITLKVSAAGGYGKRTYKFVYKYNGKTYTIRDYKSATQVKWKPKKTGTYTLYVYAKDSDGKVVKKSIQKYKVVR